MRMNSSGRKTCLGKSPKDGKHSTLQSAESIDGPSLIVSCVAGVRCAPKRHRSYSMRVNHNVMELTSALIGVYDKSLSYYMNAVGEFTATVCALAARWHNPKPYHRHRTSRQPTARLDRTNKSSSIVSLFPTRIHRFPTFLKTNFTIPLQEISLDKHNLIVLRIFLFASDRS